MATAAEQLRAHPHVETIKRYYAACSAADVDGVVACCTPDVVHYFLARGTEPVRGAEHLGRYWRKVVALISAEWTVEHAIACDDEAVIEFSQRWTSPEDGKRYICHGAEWYAFRDGLISESARTGTSVAIGTPGSWAFHMRSAATRRARAAPRWIKRDLIQRNSPLAELESGTGVRALQRSRSGNAMLVFRFRPNGRADRSFS